MDLFKSTIGMIGISIGAIALLLAIVSFFEGPFTSPLVDKPTISTKINTIKKSLITIVKKERFTQEVTTKPTLNIDKVISVSVSLLSVIAILLGLFSFIKKEYYRVSLGAAAMGASALVFQFIAMYAFAIIILLVIFVVIANFGD